MSGNQGRADIPNTVKALFLNSPSLFSLPVFVFFFTGERERKRGERQKQPTTSNRCVGNNPSTEFNLSARLPLSLSLFPLRKLGTRSLADPRP